MNITFRAFGLAHLAVLGAVPVLAAFLSRLHRRLPAAGKPTRYALAAVLAVNSAAFYASFVLRGEPLFPGHLPLELCDASVWLVIAALLTLRPALFDVAWYWAIAGAGNALFTPNFTQASWLMWVQYFVSHGLIVATTERRNAMRRSNRQSFRSRGSSKRREK